MTESREPKPRSPGSVPDSPDGLHHIADEPLLDQPDGGEVRNPTTETGLPVEDQVRKEWEPGKDGGLPMPLQGLA
jgi:hypothetical protein